MKDSTFESHKERICKSLVYIQENLAGNLTLEKLASVSCLSQFHFHRIFKAMVGDSVSAYIQRIRLEQAAFQLRYTKKTIAEIAKACGYQSYSSFIKAFKRKHNMTPRDYLRRSFSSCKHLECENDYIAPQEVKIIPQQKVIFVRRIGAYEDAAKSAWNALLSFAYANNIINAHTRFIGITHDCPDLTSAQHIRYDACMTFSGQYTAQGEFAVQTIKGGKYCVFRHYGEYEKIHNTYQLIFNNWYPQSKVVLADAPSFAVYHGKPMPGGESDFTDIYIPVCHHSGFTHQSRDVYWRDTS